MSLYEEIKIIIGELDNLKNKLFSINEKILENEQTIPVEPPVIVCPPEPEPKPEPEPEKPKYEMYIPAHEVLGNVYLNPSERNVFTKGKFDPVLDQKLNIKKYFIYYPSGVSASEFQSGKIDTDKIAQKVIEQVGENFEGIGMLDYESEWFAALDKGIDNKENNHITEVMIQAIHELKKRFPKIKWGYYDIPKMPYWLPHPSPTNSYTWGNAPEELKEQTMSFYHDAYARLLKECDYMNVSRYHRYDPAAHAQDISLREYEWRKKCTELAHRINKTNGTNLPIYAMYHKAYPVGGKAEFTGKLVQTDFMIDTLVKPNIEAGVAGFMYWDAIHYYAWTALPTNNTTPNYTAGNAFCKNYNYDYSTIPWKMGQGPESERKMWRDKNVELSSQSALSIIVEVHKYVNNL